MFVMEGMAEAVSSPHRVYPPSLVPRYLEFQCLSQAHPAGSSGSSLFYA